MVPWSFVRGELRRRPGRALLTLGSVMIGVATVVAVSSSITTTRRAISEMYQTLAGRAALEVRAAGGKEFGTEALDQLQSAPGVEAALPVLTMPGRFVFQSEGNDAILLGIDPDRDKLARDYRLEQGAWLSGKNQILMEAGLARSMGIGLGDRLVFLVNPKPRPGRRIGISDRTRRAEVVGLLKPRGVAAFQGGTLVVMALGDLQQWYAAENQVNAIHLVLKKGAEAEQVAGDVASRLPEGLSVAPPAARTEMAREMLFSNEQGLNMAATLSLVAAAFIVVNSFFMNLTERRRQLATLRTIGATRRQVLALILGEGLLTGVAGTLLGIGIGLAGASLLLRVMERIYDTGLPALEIHPEPLIRAALLGPGLALAGALLPAWAATRISPLEGMRRVSVDASDKRRPIAAWIAWGLIAAAAVGGVLLYQGVLPADATRPIVAGAMIGMSLLLPVLLVGMVRPLTAAAERSKAVSLFLACRQILRQRTRSSLTAGVLFVAVVMSVGMGNSVVNNTDDVRQWVQRAVKGDFIVRDRKMLSMSTGEAPPIPDAMLDRVRAVPGVVTVEPWTFIRTMADGEQMVAVARTFPDDAPLSLDLYRGEPDDVRRRLRQGEAVISTVVAQRLKKDVGDTITLSGALGDKTLRIAGIVDDYIMGGTVFYLDSSTAERLLGVTGINTLLVRAQPERHGEVGAALARLARDNHLLCQSTAELAGTLDEMMAGVVAAMWGMLVVGFIVAAFGMVNTLTMNVLEQTRELGMLRVVGMTRPQVRRYVVCQAAVMGLAGILPGAAVGEGVAYIINQMTEVLMGHPTEFNLRLDVVAGCVVFGLLLTILAALLPAARAAGLLIGEAIQYE